MLPNAYHKGLFFLTSLLCEIADLCPVYED